MTKYLVVGGAGFIGSHVVDRLMAMPNSKVTVFDNLSTGKKAFLSSWLGHKQFQFVRGDLLKAGDIEKVIKGQDVVFHLAANSDIMRAMNDPGLDFRQGTVATFHVLEAMRKKQVRKLLYLSGSGVYGDFGQTYISEKMGPLNPKSMYGAAKLSSEAMISAYSHLYGIQAWVFRPANIIGARPTHGVIYDFIANLKKNPKCLRILGDGTQSKSYLHISDLISAVFTAFKNGVAELNHFNVASETYLDVKSIAEIVIRKMNLTRVQIIFGTEPRGWRGDIPQYRLDIGQLKSLGWRPIYNSSQAVEKTTDEILSQES